MAGTKWNVIMAKLFVQARKSMKFYMGDCVEKKDITKVIEKHGGKMLQTREQDSIEIVPYDIGAPFTNKVSHPVYSYNFIKDSISLKLLQDLKDYRMAKYATARSQTRKAYRQDEEEIMKKYVETHAGSPTVVKFWEDALKKGLNLDHTPDSLRYHWKHIIPKKTNQENKINLPVKRSSTPIASPYVSPVKKPKEERLFIPDEDEMKSIKIVVKQNKRDILDFGEINVRCEEEDIDDKFERLVNICSTTSGRRISVQEVLRALIARNGVVKATIEHFSNPDS